jgi:hypothetical protein
VNDSLDDVFVGLAQALLIGLLLGLERERARAGERVEGFAGIRTFPLFTLAGFLAALFTGAVRVTRWPGCWVASRAPPPSPCPSRGRAERFPTWRGRSRWASFSHRRCCTSAARSS